MSEISETGGRARTCGGGAMDTLAPACDELGKIVYGKNEMGS